jgi:hypothetical protein
MGVYERSGIAVNTWVDMVVDVPVRYEVDRDDELATLHFGHSSDYVLTLSHSNLKQLIKLAVKAEAELDAPDPDPAGNHG